MINTNTVFVLGAGASNPYGYPTGEALRCYICNNFNKHFSIIFQDNKLLGSKWISKAKHLSKIFKDSSTPSIDLFLARNHDYSDIGKLSILLSILDYERKSKFREEIDDVSQDWYSYLYRRMTNTLIEPDSYKNFSNNKVSFITFNYDRSLEYFLYESLKNSFSSAQDNDIINELKKIPIHHVYGKVIDLPWENPSGETSDYLNTKDYESPYQRFNFATLQKLSENIINIHERSKKDFSTINDIILQAERIYFLGFGYAPENLDILQLKNSKRMSDPNVYGTAYRFLKKEIKDIRQTIISGFKFHSAYDSNPNIDDIDCITLLRTFL